MTNKVSLDFSDLVIKFKKQFSLDEIYLNGNKVSKTNKNIANMFLEIINVTEDSISELNDDNQ